MITHKELQRFLPLDECAGIISHCLAIKEVVHTNQEVPEIQGAFVSRSDDLREIHVFDGNNIWPLSAAWLSSCFVWTKPAGGVYFMLGSNMEVHFAQVQLITTLSMTKGNW